jgi:hypothetical protein
MLRWAAALLALAALGGATLATLHFRGRSPLPMPLALLHGALAATGLVLLVIAALQPGFGGLAMLSLVIFLLAALGGFYLFSFQLRGLPLPSAVVLAHGSAAVIGFVLLLAFLMATPA